MIEVSSASYTAEVQSDGRHWVREKFTLSDGVQTYQIYLAAIGEDLDAHLAVSIDQINSSLNPEVE